MAVIRWLNQNKHIFLTPTTVFSHFILSYLLGLFVSCVVLLLPPFLSLSFRLHLPSSFFKGLSVTGADEVHSLTFPQAEIATNFRRKTKRVSSHPPSLLCHLFTILSVWNIIQAWLWNGFILYNFAQLRNTPGWKARHTELSILLHKWKHSHRMGASEGKLTHCQHQVIYSWAQFGFIADWLIKYWENHVSGLFSQINFSSFPQSDFF